MAKSRQNEIDIVLSPIYKGDNKTTGQFDVEISCLFITQ